ncbi:MAG: hypothetical protein IJ529_06375 [Alphaproteobacteria bacterium]|nr:hypothetical protein [Alphaproteobacteria bacterium]MBQ9235073.1 hypothetical protein [Alphaproteobacteria bacterium]
MSNYWKQALVIGGIYWVFSLFLYWGGIFGATYSMWAVIALLADALLAVVLLVFLLPLKWLAPIKRVDNFMHKYPRLATLLASVGWVPYMVAVTFLMALVATLATYTQGNPAVRDSIFSVVDGLTTLRRFAMLLMIVTTLVAVFAMHKTIVGVLPVQTKSSPEKAKALKEEQATAKAAKAALRTVKKPAAKKATALIEKADTKAVSGPKTVKKTAVKTKKTAAKTAAGVRAPVKKATAKKPAAKKKEPKKTAVKKK